MTRIIALLLVVAPAMPAAAQITFANGDTINDQSAYVKQIQELQYEACFGPQAEWAAAEIAKWSGTPDEKCEKAKALYDKEVNILIRMMHGDPLMVLCIGDGSCTFSIVQGSN